MKDVEILKEEFKENGSLDIESFNARKRTVSESLKPRDFLTTAELNETKKALETLRRTLPRPTGWAHALLIGSIQQTIDDFSPDRSYCSNCLGDLQSALIQARLKDDNIVRKIDLAIRTAERYGVEDCLFPDTLGEDKQENPQTGVFRELNRPRIEKEVKKIEKL